MERPGSIKKFEDFYGASVFLLGSLLVYEGSDFVDLLLYVGIGIPGFLFSRKRSLFGLIFIFWFVGACSVYSLTSSFAVEKVPYYLNLVPLLLLCVALYFIFTAESKEWLSGDGISGFDDHALSAVEKTTSSISNSWVGSLYRFRYPLVAALVVVLVFSNPKTEDVYELLASNARDSAYEEIGKNPVLGLVSSGVVSQITPEVMRTIFRVEHLDAYIGSLFIVAPTSLGAVALTLRGERPEQITFICGLAGLLFKCPNKIVEALGGDVADDQRSTNNPESQTAPANVKKVDDFDRRGTSPNYDVGPENDRPKVAVPLEWIGYLPSMRIQGRRFFESDDITRAIKEVDSSQKLLRDLVYIAGKVEPEVNVRVNEDGVIISEWCEYRQCGSALSDEFTIRYNPKTKTVTAVVRRDGVTKSYDASKLKVNQEQGSRNGRSSRPSMDDTASSTPVPVLADKVKVIDFDWEKDPSFGISGTIKWSVTVRNDSLRNLESAQIVLFTFDKDGQVVSRKEEFISNLPTGKTVTIRKYAPLVGSEVRAEVGVESVFLAGAERGLRTSQSRTESSLPAAIRYLPTAEEYYPRRAKAAGEEGNVVVRACVDSSDQLIGQPTIVTSSGSISLDQGAVELAKAGRYRAARSSGQPVPQSCVSFRVKFEIL